MVSEWCETKRSGFECILSSFREFINLAFLQVIGKDSNVMLVSLAGNCLTSLAKGLRKNFVTYGPNVSSLKLIYNLALLGAPDFISYSFVCICLLNLTDLFAFCLLHLTEEVFYQKIGELFYKMRDFT